MTQLQLSDKLGVSDKTNSKGSYFMSKINTVIFDMDGTVLNTLDDLTTSVNYTMEKFGFPQRTLDEYRQAFGSGIRRAIELTVPEGTSQEVIDEMIPVFKEHYDVHCLDKTGPYVGIIELMRELKKRGYKMAIVSNKIDSAVKELNQKFFSEVIEVAIGEQDGIKRKPAPDMVNMALDRLGVSKDDAIYIGDSEVDLNTAKNSQLDMITVTWGFRDRDHLIQNGATVFADTPEQILDLL